MKRRDLVRKISQEAQRQEVPWKIDHEGTRHSVYRLGTRLIPVSCHNELGEGLVRAIFIEREGELGKGWWRL